MKGAVEGITGKSKGRTKQDGFCGYFWRKEEPADQTVLEVVDFIGGPGRTRACNQTVMSGRIEVRYVDSIAFSSEVERVRCALALPFLARNGCGRRAKSQGTTTASISVSELQELLCRARACLRHRGATALRQRRRAQQQNR
jgi:hypothetical protein